jgi:hypothetical protein
MYLPKWTEHLHPHKNLYTDVFIAFLFIIAKLGHNQKCLSGGEFVIKLWYMQTMKCYLSVKRNKHQAIKRCGGNCNAPSSVVKATVKGRHTKIPSKWHSEKRTLWRQQKRPVVFRQGQIGRGFLVQGNYCLWYHMVSMCHYKPVKIYKRNMSKR